MKTRFDSVKLNELGISKISEIKAKAEDLARVIEQIVPEYYLSSYENVYIQEKLKEVTMLAVASLKKYDEYLEKGEK